MKNPEKNNFTLLEVLCAMFILVLGISALFGQLALAVSRQERSLSEWEETHDLIQAAEFRLIHGPAIPLDETLLTGRHQVEFHWTMPDFSGDPALSGTTLRCLQLRTLMISLYRNGEKKDELSLDVWVEGANAAGI